MTDLESKLRAELEYTKNRAETLDVDAGRLHVENKTLREDLRKERIDFSNIRKLHRAALKDAESLRARVAELERELEEQESDVNRGAERTHREMCELRAEIEAYRRAKAENDDRFMVERDEARAEVERLRGMLGSEGWTDAGATMYDQITTLRAALRRYGQHENECRKRSYDTETDCEYVDHSQPCSCGLDAALGED